MKPRIITISDVVLGYGSPQILDFTVSLCNLMGAGALICQPLVPQRKVLELGQPCIRLETLHSAEHPYSERGRNEYLQKCAALINSNKPDVLILANYNLFGVLDRLAYRPSKIIHLALEDLDSAVDGFLSDSKLAFIRSKSVLIDNWIFPESNRAKYDACKLNISHGKITIFYNVQNINQLAVDSTQIQPKIVYAGTLNVVTSVGRYIFDKELIKFPIDVYGNFDGDAASKIELESKVKMLSKTAPDRCHLRWLGYIPGQKLEEILASYSYSLIYWLPVRHALLNAAPNKFFQAIASSVPVISAPHPQAKMLIERYGCGILLDGWEKHQLIAGLKQAVKIMGTPLYDEMKANCRHAIATELSWSAQMMKFANRFNVKEW